MSGQEDAALLAEIARLSGQIDKHRSQPQGQHYPQQSYYRGGGRGGWNARGGRGGAAHASGGTRYPAPSRHRTLVIDNSRTGNAANGSAAAFSATADPSVAASDASSSSSLGSQQSHPPAQDGWVKRKTTHNMSLVSSSTFEKTEPARLAALQASQEAKAKAMAQKTQARVAQSKTSRPKSKSNADVRRGDNMGEVIIDGVVFVFDESGTKLVKKPAQADNAQEAQSSESNSASASTSVAPMRTSVNGQAFVRTKNGNLISAELAEKRKAQKESQIKMKKMEKLGQQIGQNEKVRSANRKPQNKTLQGQRGPKGLCTFFTKTGQCKRGLSCPYTHDASKLAICPGALRPSGCNQPAGMCPLSHTLSPQRVPHCVHYLRSGSRTCRNGDNCLYVHPGVSVDISQNSPVCLTFARVGWCSNGKECVQRHTFDCPDFLEKGSCERKGCKLQHVIRPGEAAAGGAAAADEQPSQPHVAVRPALISAVGNAARKRKSSPAADVDGDGSDGSGAGDADDDDPAISFARGAGRKRRKAKGFTQQKDYIGFDDEESGEEEAEEEEEDGEDDGELVSSDSEEEEDSSESGDSSDGDSDSDADGGSDSSS